MAVNKKQHTVQKQYLQQWKTEEGLFIYDLKNKASHPAEAKSILTENYIYNWDHDGPENKFMIDNVISLIENEGIAIIKKIQNEKISDEEKKLLSRYIALQAMRTPKQREATHNLAIALMKERLIESLKNSEMINEFTENKPEEVKKLINNLASNPEKEVIELFNKTLTVKIRNIKDLWLKETFLFLTKLTQRYYDLPWIILKSNDARSFITSDNPVVTISRVANPKIAYAKDVLFTEITFPLSSKILLLIQDDKNGSSFKRGIFYKDAPEDEKSVRELNYRTAIWSDRYIVSHSRKLLERIAKNAWLDWHDTRNDVTAYEKRAKRQIPVKLKPKSNAIRFIKRVYS